MDGVLHEKVIKLLGSIFCTDNYIIADHPAACSAGGCGDYFEYIPVPDDPDHHHDDPGAFGVRDLSLAPFGHDVVPPWNQRVDYKEHSDKFRFFRTDHQGFW